MLFHQLRKVYQQYKQDTNSVVSWLASTAKAHGYPSDLLLATSPEGDKTESASKGPKGGKTKRQPRHNNSDATSADGVKYVVGLADYVPLAIFIAQRVSPVVSVPKAFYVTINRLIRLRSSFRDEMEACGLRTDPKSDKSHSHVVDILVEVKAILDPLVNVAAMTSPSSEASAATGKGSPDNRPNRYSGLSVEEPSQDFLDDFYQAYHATPTQPKPVDDGRDVYEAEPEVSLEDAIFVFAAVVTELNKIRESIRWIWSNYANGTLDLAACAAATNAATALARTAIEESEKDLFKMFRRGAYDLVRHLCTLHCSDKGYKPGEFNLDSQWDLHDATYQVANDDFFAVYKLLNHFLKLVKKGEPPFVFHGQFGEYDPASHRACKTTRQKARDDKIIMMEIFGDLMIIIRRIPDWPYQDEFLGGMRELDRTRKVPFYLVFAAQVSLDIRHVMSHVVGTDVPRGELTAHAQYMTMYRDIGAHIQFTEGNPEDVMSAKYLGTLKWLSGALELVMQDCVHHEKAQLHASLGRTFPPEEHREHSLNRNLVLNGFTLFKARVSLNMSGMLSTVANRPIGQMAHIYNAMHRLGFLDHTWSDMDLAVAVLGESTFWKGGEPPTTVDDILMKYNLSLGVSASWWTRGMSMRPPKMYYPGSRIVRRRALVSLLCAKLFKPDRTPDERMDAGLICDIIRMSKYEIHKCEGDRVTVRRLSDEREIRNKERARVRRVKDFSAGIRRRSATAADSPEYGRLKEARSDPGAYIKRLVVALQSESMELGFPLLMLHRICWSLQQDIVSECFNDAPGVRHITDFKPGTRQSTHLMQLLLCFADCHYGGPEREALETAAAVINRMIAEGGGKMAIFAAHQSGHRFGFETQKGERLDFV